MNYTIEGVIEKYPEINIGVLTGRGLTIKRVHPDLEKYKSNSLRATMNLIGGDSVTSHPYIASMRNLYRTFGTKPADYHPSAEALVRRAIKTQQLPLINTAVDTYNSARARDFFLLYTTHIKFSAYLILIKMFIGIVFYAYIVFLLKMDNYTNITGYWILNYFMISSLFSYIILHIASNFMGAKYYGLSLNSQLGIKGFAEKSLILLEKSRKEGIFFLKKSSLCLSAFFESNGDSYPQIETTIDILNKIAKYQENIDYESLHILANSLTNNSDYSYIISEVDEFNKYENNLWCKDLTNNEWKIPKWLIALSSFIALIIPLIDVIIQLIPEEKRAAFFDQLLATLSNPISSLITTSSILIFAFVFIVNVTLIYPYRNFKASLYVLENLWEEDIDYIIYE